MTVHTDHHPGVALIRPDETHGFSLNHTMLRVKDPAVSLDFYTRVLGMRLLKRLDFAALSFSLYFLHFASQDDHIPAESAERTRWLFGQTGVLELTHNWGTESDLAFWYHEMKNIAFIKTATHLTQRRCLYDPDQYR